MKSFLNNKDIQDKIIYFSRFNSDENGNGGDKRVAQLCSVLKPLGLEFISIYDVSSKFPGKLKNVFKNSSNPIHKIILYCYRQIVTHFKYHMWSQATRKNVYYWHSITRLFCSYLANMKPKLILIDDPVFLTPLAHYAKKNHIPLVALCHNIETLSCEQVERSHQTKLLDYEIELLSNSSLVVTISREETVFLNNLGISTVHFPYYPTLNTENRMKHIKVLRSSSIKKDYIILGTVHNPPTLQGMKVLITELSLSNVESDDRFLIVGYGTENLKDFIDNNKFVLMGSVANFELDNILTGIKACIIFQENGSGALTKIPEMLVAGVPVVVNSHAARSFYNIPGVYEFRNWRELDDILSGRKSISDSELIPYFLAPDPLELNSRVASLLAN